MSPQEELERLERQDRVFVAFLVLMGAVGALLAILAEGYWEQAGVIILAFSAWIGGLVMAGLDEPIIVHHTETPQQRLERWTALYERNGH